MKRQIISGSFNYCCRAMRPWYAMGYRIVKSKKWGDGKYTYVLEKKDRVTAQSPLDIFD